MTAPKMEQQLLFSMAKNIQELQQHLQLFGKILHERQEGAANLEVFTTLPELQAREEKLQAVIVEAINELEESRKSFKSKRLEQLRKRLTQVLVESK